MLGHKAHQIQLFWKGWAVFPAPKGYSHALNPAVILLPPVFSLWWLFFCLLGGGGSYEHAIAWSSVILPYVFSVFFFMSRQYVRLQLSPRSLFWPFRPLSSRGTGVTPFEALLPQLITFISRWVTTRKTHINGLDIALHQFSGCVLILKLLHPAVRL